MKAEEIRPCDGCGGELVGDIHSGKTANFYAISVRTLIPDYQALRERAGMQMMGFPFMLADTFSSRSDVAIEMPDRTDLLLCFKCAESESLIMLMEKVRL